MGNLWLETKKLFTTLSTGKAILIIVIIGFAVFGNSLRNGFVADDISQIVNNSSVHALSNLGSLFVNVHTTYFRPLMYVFFSALYNSFGANPLPFHLFQVTLYIINAILAFFLFKSFFNQKLALGLSLVFLLHPMNAEAAIYISNLQEVLFLLFGISALLLILRRPLMIWNFLLLNLLLLASLLSKETGLVFVFSAVALAFFYQRKILPKISVNCSLVILEYLFFRFKLAGIFFAKPITIPIARLLIFERILNVPAVIWYYFKTFFFPKNLAIWQLWTIPRVDFLNFYLPLILILVIIATFIFSAKKTYSKNKDAFLALIFFGVLLFSDLAIHSQIFPLDNTVADRWFYLGSLGLLGIIGVIVSEFSVKTERSKKILFTGFLLILIILSVRTIYRNTNFRDEITLFTHDSKVTRSPALENLLGYALFQKGDIKDAGPHLAESVKLSPYDWSSWNNLGVYYVADGDLKEAQESFQRAASVTENNPHPLLNEASTFLAEHQYSQSLDMTNKLYEQYPQLPQTLLVMAVAEYRLGDKNNALNGIIQSNKIFQSVQASYLYSKIVNNQEIDDSYLLKSFLNLL